MTDDPFDRLGRRPTPRESLWSLRIAGVTWEAELRFHGESYGWGAQLLRQGELVIGRRFDTKALAIQWAEVERLAYRVRRWSSESRFVRGQIEEIVGIRRNVQQP